MKKNEKKILSYQEENVRFQLIEITEGEKTYYECRLNRRLKFRTNNKIYAKEYSSKIIYNYTTMLDLF